MGELDFCVGKPMKYNLNPPPQKKIKYIKSPIVLLKYNLSTTIQSVHITNFSLHFLGTFYTKFRAKIEPFKLKGQII